MAYRYLIYSTGTTYSGTILKDNGAVVPSPSALTASYYTNFVIPQIQPLYLWQVDNVVTPTTLIPNTDTKINNYGTAVAPPPTSSDSITYGQTTGLTNNKISKFVGVTGNIPLISSSGQALSDSGYSIAGIITAGSGVTTTTFNKYTGTTAPATYAQKSLAITGATNLGTATPIYTSVSANKIQLKSLSGGTGISIGNTGTQINICGCVFNWSGNTANGVGTYVSATCIKSNPNLTFNGSALSVTGNINASTYVSAPTITGSTKVCSPIIAGTSCVTSPVTIGTTCVCGPVILGSTYVCSPVITGSTKICSPIVCGTSCITSPITCGTSCVISPITIGTSCVCSPIILGSTCVCSQTLCASTSAFSVTPAANNNSTCIATTAWYFGQSGNTTPLMDGTAAIGGSLKWSHSDHVHPSDTSRVTKLTGATQNNIVTFGVGGAISDSGKIFTTTVNPAGSATNSCVPTELAVRNAINSAVASMIVLQGDWNATTNVPSLTGPLSGYTTGFAWRVAVSGTTSLSGINLWDVGDMAVKGATSWIRVAGSDIDAVWGNISGTISSQTDLNNCLNARVTTGTFQTYTGTTAPSQFASKGSAITGATNLGSGNAIYTSVSANKVQLKSISGGTGISISNTGTQINICSSISQFSWTGNTANGVGTYAGANKVCSNPNMTFDGTSLSITGNIKASTYVCSPIITGSTKVCSPIICGTSCITSPVTCGTSCVTTPIVLASNYVCAPTITGSTKVCSPIICGTSCITSPITIGTTCVCSPVVLASTCVCSPLHCGACGYFSTAVCSPIISGSTKVCSPIICGTSCITSPITCGTSCVTTPIVLASSYVCSPVITGSTKICSPIVCGTSCVISPVTIGSTCVCSPVVLASTCVCSPLHCGACGYFSTAVCSPIISGSTKVCSPIIAATSCVTAPTICGTTNVLTPIVCASSCVRSPLLSGGTLSIITSATVPTPSANNNSTCVATTAWYFGQCGTATPLMNGTGTVGTSQLWAHQDHVHPSDTTKLNVSVFTGYTASTVNKDKKIQVVSTGSTNVNTVAATPITWNIANPYASDMYGYTGGSANILIKTAGTYEVQYGVVLKNDNANQTHSVGGYLIKNNLTTIPLTATAAMVVGSNASGQLSLPSAVITLAANDKIELAGFRIGAVGTVNIVSGSVFMLIDKLT